MEFKNTSNSKEKREIYVLTERYGFNHGAPRVFYSYLEAFEEMQNSYNENLNEYDYIEDTSSVIEKDYAKIEGSGDWMEWNIYHYIDGVLQENM